MGTRKTKAMKDLPVQLTMDELLGRGDRLANIEFEIVALEQKRNEVNAAIKALREERKQVALQVRDKEETRSVTCEWEPDFRKNAVRLKRTDTGEVVDQRAMTADERQQEMFDPSIPGDAEAAAKAASNVRSLDAKRAEKGGNAAGRTGGAEKGKAAKKPPKGKGGGSKPKKR